MCTHMPATDATRLGTPCGGTMPGVLAAAASAALAVTVGAGLQAWRRPGPARPYT
jgi:hypothetical protein